MLIKHMKLQRAGTRRMAPVPLRYWARAVDYRLVYYYGTTIRLFHSAVTFSTVAKLYITTQAYKKARRYTVVY